MATAPCLMAPPSATVSLFAPPVIAILVIIGVAVLLLLYHTLLSRIHQVDASDAESSPFHVETVIWPTPRGLDEAAVRLIPIFHYSKKKVEAGGATVEGTECAVCLGEFREAESLRALPKCGHAFHIPCIDQWLRSHSNCPLCRAPLSPLHATSS